MLRGAILPLAGTRFRGWEPRMLGRLGRVVSTSPSYANVTGSLRNMRPDAVGSGKAPLRRPGRPTAMPPVLQERDEGVKPPIQGLGHRRLTGR